MVLTAIWILIIFLISWTVKAREGGGAGRGKGLEGRGAEEDKTTEHEGYHRIRGTGQGAAARLCEIRKRAWKAQGVSGRP